MGAETILTDVQDDALAKLLSEPELATINMSLLRKLLTTSEVDASVVYMTARGGKSGTGLVVGMPFLDAEAKETGIADSMFNLPIYAFESPDISQDATNGCLMTAEEALVRARRIFRGWVLNSLSFFTEDKSIEPFEPPDYLKGTVSYRLTVKARLRQVAAQRCALPTLTENALTVTLTNGTSGATIYYTTDDSFPGPGNTDADVYTTPFVVESGDVVRWAAYKSGLQGSHAGRATIT